MPNQKPFGHSLKLLLLSGCAALMTACASTTPAPTQQRVPVAQVPVQTQTPTPAGTPTAETEPKDVKEVDAQAPEEPAAVEPEPVQTAETPQTGPYFNNRDGLTPPHMTGRDTKRLALLLPFSTSSSRLAQEAQSMYRAAEMAVFDRTDTDVLLFALDTKGTEEGAKSATKTAIAAGADVILGPILAGNVKASAREAAAAIRRSSPSQRTKPSRVMAHILCLSRPKPKSHASWIMLPALAQPGLPIWDQTALMGAA